MRVHAPFLLLQMVPDKSSRVLVEFKRTQDNRQRACVACGEKPQIMDTESVVCKLELPPEQAFE